MANEEHLAKLSEGVKAWNQWRSDNPDTRPYLDNADLAGVHLLRVNLADANLSKAILSNAILANAILADANLSRARIARAYLGGANLFRANLTGANLFEADLSGTNLGSVDFRGANLLSANLTGADLSEANLNRVDFGGADLRRVDLSGANLELARLVDVRMGNCTLTGAKLWQAQTEGWDIRGAKCEYAFWDRKGHERTDYAEGEFERLHASKARLEIEYKNGLDPAEFVTLPFLIRYLETQHEGCVLRLKGVGDAPGGGAKATVVIEEPGVDDVDTLLKDLEREVGELRKVTQQAIDVRNLATDLLPEYQGVFCKRPVTLQQFITVNIGDATKVNVGNLETDFDRDDS